MNKFNIIKSVIALVSLAVLSGCASPMIQSSGVEESTYRSSESVSSNHILHRNISVETNGFLETSKSLVSKQSKSNLNNEDAKKAIENSLNSAGMLGDANSEYLLTATLIDADLGSIWTNKASKREISVQYSITTLFSKGIYDNVITGIGENDFKLFTVDNYGREKSASEKAYKDNFRQLIEDLKNL
ncbi:hypothetical protein [Vreelandella neptunia]|uniref:Lipoprotein n=1 Tax=Vreelandella neptunia TaxID=115551 RepID=A0ABS9S9Q7_9GAMM|nr:hypothetical protein [Halomonas neptunia]MCH4812844.1 hypothetical protein [Halomonas neptunia]